MNNALAVRSMRTAVVGAVFLAGAPASAEEPKEGAPVPKANAAQKAADAAEKRAAEAAISSQPQIPAIRGGTLGIPSSGTAKGLQAGLGGQVTTASKESDSPSGAGGNDDHLSVELSTRLGGLDLRIVEVEILAEQYSQNLPRVTVGTATPPASPGMFLTDMTAIGLRARYRFDEKRWTVASVAPVPLDIRAVGGDSRDEIVAKKTVSSLFSARSGWALAGGLRFLRRSTRASEKDEFAGLAGEASVLYARVRDGGKLEGCEQQKGADMRDAQSKVAAATAALAEGEAGDPDTQSEEEKAAVAERQAAVEKAKALLATAKARDCDDGKGYRLSGFLSLSGTHHNEETQMLDGAMVLYPRFDERRVSFGLEMQTSSTWDGALTLPRFGAYVTVSQGRWTNAFATGAQEEEVKSAQYEAAAYISGHLVGGFNGLVSFGVVKPYGQDEDLQYVLTVLPSVGASLGGS